VRSRTSGSACSGYRIIIIIIIIIIVVVIIIKIIITITAFASEDGQSARQLEFLYACNNNYGTRAEILANLGHSIPAFHNSYPAAVRSYFCGALRSLVSLSPQGTAPDGFRHMEMLTAGTMVIMPDREDLRVIYAGLPVIFAQFPLTPTCESLMAAVRERAAQAAPFAYERLTLRWWLEYVQAEARAGAAEHPATIPIKASPATPMLSLPVLIHSRPANSQFSEGR